MPTKKVNPKVQKELDRAQKDFDEFQDQVKEASKDAVNDNPVKEEEHQTQMSSRELKFAKTPTIKCEKVIFPPRRKDGSAEKFNEQFRKEYEFKKEYVEFIAENIEIPGEMIEFWTKPYPGVPAQFWSIPSNTPVRAPRFVAERIEACNYNVLKMDEKEMGQEQGGIRYYGRLVTKDKKARLSARPIKSNKFASNF